MIKRILFGVLLILPVIAANNAMATLPVSTYGTDNGWYGTAVYKEQGYNVVVQYAVYDNWAQPKEFDWQGDIDMRPSDQYIYAYQIFNMGTGATTEKDVAAFNLLDSHKNPIAQEFMHSTTSQTDGAGAGGIAPDPLTSPGNAQGSWTWSAANGYVKAGQHSWFLVYSSDKAPVKGTFTVSAPVDNSDIPLPDDTVPEPTSLALFGLASGIFAAVRKNRKNKSIEVSSSK
jgi:hypothetical protein